MSGLGQGWVTTARGKELNLDELIAKAKKPINAGDLKNTVPQAPAPARTAVNVRGFTPSAGTAPKTVAVAAAPEAPKVESKAPPSAYTGGEATSVADMTGIKVNQVKYLKDKKPKDPQAVAHAALGEVLGELQAITNDVSGENLG